MVNSLWKTSLRPLLAKEGKEGGYKFKRKALSLNSMTLPIEGGKVPSPLVGEGLVRGIFASILISSA